MLAPPSKQGTSNRAVFGLYTQVGTAHSCRVDSVTVEPLVLATVTGTWTPLNDLATGLMTGWDSQLPDMYCIQI